MAMHINKKQKFRKLSAHHFCEQWIEGSKPNQVRLANRSNQGGRKVRRYVVRNDFATHLSDRQLMKVDLIYVLK